MTPSPTLPDMLKQVQEHLKKIEFSIEMNLLNCTLSDARQALALMPGIIAQAEKRSEGVSRAQPMNTVPKDGSTVLVFFKRHGWLTVSWDSLEDEGPKSEFAHWHVHDFKHGPYPLRGYVEADCWGWRPLPEALAANVPYNDDTKSNEMEDGDSK